MPPVRRLAAILAADVAGYSRLMGADEEGTHERLKAHLRDLIEPKITEHRGRIVKNTGDGFLAEFASVLDGVRCAVEVQGGMIDREPEVPEEQRIRFRIGINLGDVIVEEHDIFGDGVNVAARLEALAEPGGICISRVVRDQVRDKLPYPFENMGEQPVKNIARPVRVYRVGLGQRAPAPAPLAPVLALPDKPSIAVLPFQNMSGDPEQEYFVDGMVEEIITALSRIRWLFVIARNSSFTYKGPAVDVKQVGRELGVRYVLEGSVRKAGGRVRITAQLIDALNGTHLWADRFDGSLDDIFELQDKVAFSVAGVIEPTLLAAEIRRSAERPTSELTAYDLYLRSLNEFPHSLPLLEEAIARDPYFGPALAHAAMCCVNLINLGSGEHQVAIRRKGLDFARRALKVIGEDPRALITAAFALAALGEDIAAMMALADRGLALNPSSARGWFLGGCLRLWSGQPDLAIDHVRRAQRLNPRAQSGVASSYSYVIGAALFLARRFEEAAAELVLAIHGQPSFPTPFRYLAACYAHMGLLCEAREVVARLRTITPVPIPDFPLPLRNPVHRELYLSGLRLAAGEAT